MRQLYPEIRVKLFYARDFRALMVKYGRLDFLTDVAAANGATLPDRRAATGAPMSLHDDVEEILLDADAIGGRVAELGAQLTADYAGRDPVLVSVLKGALVFLADLMRAMDLPSSIDLMEVSSYGAATEIVRIRCGS